MTNYFHMIGSGHFTYFLRKHKNLSRFSQQGWESINHLIKKYFFNHMQQGGHNSCISETDRSSSRSMAVGKWIQRRLFWLSNEKWTKFEMDYYQISN